MDLRHDVVALLFVVAAVGTVAGCGGDSGSSGSAKPRGPASAELRSQLDAATNTNTAQFPKTRGRTLRELADSLDGSGPQIGFATGTLTTGKNQRLAFGVIDEKSGFVYAPTAVYLARSENARAKGPFAAPADLLVTDPPFRSQTAATEKDPFAALYETRVPFDSPGRYAVLAVSKIKGQDVAAAGVVTVKRPAADRVPDVGERAPRVETDTVAGAGGDIKAIETRIPPDDMHDVNFKQVVGSKPVALLFATPALCESRVCGPVVDIAAQLKSTYGDQIAFIHQEVFVGNDANKGLRPPLKAFQLQTEPWLFVVGADGRVTARLEGSFGFNAFERALKTAVKPQ